MIKAIISDFSKTLLFPKDPSYQGKLNDLHKKLIQENPNYDFWQYFRLNEGLLDHYKSIMDKTKLYIFTSEYIQEHPPVKSKIQSIFTKILIAKDLGVDKNDPNTFTKIAKIINCKPQEILFIDDSKDNANAAKSKDYNIIIHSENLNKINQINNYINS